MSKPLPLGLALLSLIFLACATTPPPAAPAPVQVAVPVAAAEPEPPGARGLGFIGAADEPGPIPIGAADPALGHPDALVTIVQFSDFQCPFCARATETLKLVRAKYGPDQLRLVWKNNPLPFHPNARPAAIAAMIVHERLGNDGFWTAYDAFFGEQRRLDVLPAEVAGRLGVDLQSPAARRDAEAKVDADMALAKQLNVTGAPMFFINGVLLAGAQPIEKFTAVIDEQIQKAQELIGRGTPRGRTYSALTAAQWKPPPSAPPPPSAEDVRKKTEEEHAIHLVPVGSSAVRGKATAPVTIVEFGDFQCPFCARAEETLRQVTARYGDKVRLVWKHNPLPFHTRAAPAAELAIEARAQKGDKAFWAAHDLLFHRECQGDPTATDESACQAKGASWIVNQRHLEDADLLAYAKVLGLDATRVSAALAGSKHAGELEADQELGEDVSASGTPHFFINGRRLVGAQPLEKFTAIIDEEMAKAEALIKGGVPAAKVYERTLTAAVAPPPPPRKTVPAPTRSNPSRGPAGAKVVVQMFADFQCPFCRRAASTLEEVEKAFPGKIRLVWRHLPLPMHKDAELAAEAAMAAFDQKGSPGFFAMEELLYAAQSQPGGLERPALERYAVQLGLDPVKFASALDTRAHQALIDADKSVAAAAGIGGTPGFVVNGYFINGAVPAAAFKRVIRRALAEAK